MKISKCVLCCQLYFHEIFLHSPSHPDKFDWSELYPNIGDKKVEFADIGCGYGGFLGKTFMQQHHSQKCINSCDRTTCLHTVTLGEIYPDKYAIGMEIRVKVSDYMLDRIRALRHMNPTKYENIACLRTNAMKYLPNFFYKSQLSKMFFLYPDPHFKKSKHKWRIINHALLTEYSYVLRKGVSN